MTDSEIAKAFVSRLLELLATGEFRNPAAFADLLAEEVVLHTPRFWKPITNRNWMMGVLSMVPQAIEAFAYHRIWTDNGDVLMEFRGAIDGKNIQGIDIFTLDASGRVRELTVMMRPPNALAALGEREDALLAKLFGVSTQAEFAAGTTDGGTPNAD